MAAAWAAAMVGDCASWGMVCHGQWWVMIGACLPSGTGHRAHIFEHALLVCPVAGLVKYVPIEQMQVSCCKGQQERDTQRGAPC